MISILIILYINHPLFFLNFYPNYIFNLINYSIYVIKIILLLIYISLLFYLFSLISIIKFNFMKIYQFKYFSVFKKIINNFLSIIISLLQINL